MPVKRFRWRVIPAGFLGFMGVLSLVGSLVGTGMMAWSIFEHPELLDFMIRHHPDAVLAVPIMFIIGILLIVSARLWWTGKWSWAVATTVISIVLLRLPAIIEAT